MIFSTFKRSATGAALMLAVAGGAQAAAVDVSGEWNNVAVVGTGTAANLFSLDFLSPFTGNDLYVSVDMKLGFAPDTGDNVFVWLDNVKTGTHAAVPNFGLFGQNGTAGDVRIRPQSGDGKAVAGSVLNAGDSFTLLVHLSKSVPGVSSVFDSMEAWYNPAVGSVAGAANVKTTLSSGGLSSFSAIGLRRAAGLESGETVTVSNLKIGTTYADVSPVPEPSSMVMLMAGLGMMGVIARRRIRA